MRHTDVERKRPSAWPWLAGAAALVLILLGISTLLTDGDEAEPQVTVPTVEDTYPPAAIPAPPDLDPVLTGADAARAVDEIAPLGEEDVGQVVRLDGQVVATGNESFWLLAGHHVLRVDSPRRVRKDDSLSVRGTLQSADPSTTDRIASDVLSRNPGAAEWQVVRVIKLVEEEEPDRPASGARSVPRPGA